MLASHFSMDVAHHKWILSPVGTLHNQSAEDVALIVLDSAVAQEGCEFLLEKLLTVVCFLISDIFLHHRDLRWAYAECSIPLLPGEFGSHPMG